MNEKDGYEHPVFFSVPLLRPLRGRGCIASFASAVVGVSLGFFPVAWASAPPKTTPLEATASPLSRPEPSPTPVPEPTPTCRGLSLGEASAPDELKELYAAIADFERAFEKNDTRLFQELVHPALSRERKQLEPFQSTVQDFGLEKVKLARNAVLEATFPTGTQKMTVACGGGELRGVVGPTRQFAVMHSYSGGNEQIRLFTLFAPIPPALQDKQGKDKREIGIVMMFAQVWTHGRRSPEALLADAKKWDLLNEPIAAWVMAEAGNRILAANPYFTAGDLAGTSALAANTKAKLPGFDGMRARMNRLGIGWEFAELAVVFQADGVEVGVKVRMKQEEPLNAQMEKCKAVVGAAAEEFPGLVQRFSGVECMPYGPGEGLDGPPNAGTQFHTWKSIKK